MRPLLGPSHTGKNLRLVKILYCMVALILLAFMCWLFAINNEQNLPCLLIISQDIINTIIMSNGVSSKQCPKMMM